MEAGDAHQCTDLILQVTAHMNSKFSFLNGVIHSQRQPVAPFFPWDIAPDNKHCYEHTSFS